MKMIIRELEHHLGSTERVHVAHINDLNGLRNVHWRFDEEMAKVFLSPTYLDFYLQRETDRPLLIALDEALCNEYSTIFSRKWFFWNFNEEKMRNQANTDVLFRELGRLQSAALRVDDYCACPAEDEVWYRGLIRHINSEGAWVYRIDYGDVRCMPLQYLRPLKVHRRLRWKSSDCISLIFSGTISANIRRLVFNCSLANVIKPVQGWPENVIDEFKTSLTTTFLFAKINNYNPIRQLCDVELRERSSTTDH